MANERLLLLPSILMAMMIFGIYYWITVAYLPHEVTQLTDRLFAALRSSPPQPVSQHASLSKPSPHDIAPDGGFRVGFFNRRPYTVALYFQGAERSVFQTNIISGGTEFINTYTGHQFFVADPVSLQTLHNFFASPRRRLNVIRLPDPMCSWRDDSTNTLLSSLPAPIATCPAAVAPSASHDPRDVKARLAREALERKACDERRHLNNRLQPNTVPRFDSIGFLKTKMDPAMLGRIQHFFKTQYDEHGSVDENFPRTDCHINAWEIPTTMVWLNPDLRGEIVSAVLPVLEQWVNQSLESTAIYGIRLYHHGARLMNHLDRIQTHAVSAIIQVEQQVREAWPLQIASHDGVMHDIFMEPGDMVLYESAASVHGREIPLNGDYFANLFIHFRPHDWLKRIGMV